MRFYIVTYDLNRSKNYESLHRALEAYSVSTPITESAWIVATPNGDIDTLHENLAQHIDSDDELFICRIAVQASGTGLNESVTRWLQKHLFMGMRS